jgi:hypothetical protein
VSETHPEANERRSRATCVLLVCVANRDNPYSSARYAVWERYVTRRPEPYGAHGLLGRYQGGGLGNTAN